MNQAKGMISPEPAFSLNFITMHSSCTTSKIPKGVHHACVQGGMWRRRRGHRSPTQRRIRRSDSTAPCLRRNLCPSYTPHSPWSSTWLPMATPVGMSSPSQPLPLGFDGVCRVGTRQMTIGAPKETDWNERRTTVASPIYIACHIPILQSQTPNLFPNCSMSPASSVPSGISQLQSSILFLAILSHFLKCLRAQNAREKGSTPGFPVAGPPHYYLWNSASWVTRKTRRIRPRMSSPFPPLSRPQWPKIHQNSPTKYVASTGKCAVTVCIYLQDGIWPPRNGHGPEALQQAGISQPPETQPNLQVLLPLDYYNLVHPGGVLKET